VRLTAVGRTPKPDHLGEVGSVTNVVKAERARRSVFFGDGWTETPVYDGTRLAPGATVHGPALVEEPFTVVVVPPDGTCRLAEHHAYELALGVRRARGQRGMTG
jgi:N-methylhydantoinase A